MPTPPQAACAVSPACLGSDYHNAIGRPAIETHNIALRDRLYTALTLVPKVRVVSAPPGPLTSPLLTYELPASIPAGTLHETLRTKHQIEVKVVPGNFLNGNRISTHLFNSEPDVDHFVDVLKRVLA
jgi:selenocysteine lyase/cysteine desulfurase